MHGEIEAFTYSGEVDERPGEIKAHKERRKFISKESR